MPFRVRYAETDQMGRAYYANYLVWFEAARGAFCRSLGFSYADFETTGTFIPVLTVSCRYRRPLLYDQTAVVRVGLTELRSRTMRFQYEIVDDRRLLVAEGATHHGFMDRRGRLVRCPRQFWDRMQGALLADFSRPGTVVCTAEAEGHQGRGAR